MKEKPLIESASGRPIELEGDKKRPEQRLYEKKVSGLKFKRGNR